MPKCLRYMRDSVAGQWTEVTRYDYLDANWTGTIPRVLYLPSFLSKVVFGGKKGTSSHANNRPERSTPFASFSIFTFLVPHHRRHSFPLKPSNGIDRRGTIPFPVLHELKSPVPLSRDKPRCAFCQSFWQRFSACFH